MCLIGFLLFRKIGQWRQLIRTGCQYFPRVQLYSVFRDFIVREILHGATRTSPNFKGVRRTVLPWYVGVAPDNVTLDSLDSDNWDSLAVSHAKQTARARTPSGHLNMYGKIPFRFPAGIHLNIDCPVSEALLCRRSWDDTVCLKSCLFLYNCTQTCQGHENVRMDNPRWYTA